MRLQQRVDGGDCLAVLVVGAELEDIAQLALRPADSRKPNPAARARPVASATSQLLTATGRPSNTGSGGTSRAASGVAGSRFGWPGLSSHSTACRAGLASSSFQAGSSQLTAVFWFSASGP